MKRIEVYTGNRFREVEAHLLSLGYRYESGADPIRNINAMSLMASCRGRLTWTTQALDESEYSLLPEEVLALTKKDVEDEVIPHEYQPFERVLVWDYATMEWTADFFSHLRENGRISLASERSILPNQILPYEGNENKLGTKYS